MNVEKPNAPSAEDPSRAVAAPAPWSAQTIAPWAALVVASIALIVALVALFDGARETAAPAASAPFMSSTGPAPGQPPDLSSMSPREAADRLFNRVMAASEQGNTAEVSRFVPMALLAYDNVGMLDNDARYHVALLNLVSNDVTGARVQVEMLRQSVPNHLLGFLLERQIADRSGKKNNADKTDKAFLAAYDAEIAAGRTEYEDHRNSLERYRAEAQTRVAGK